MFGGIYFTNEKVISIKGLAYKCLPCSCHKIQLYFSTHITDYIHAERTYLQQFQHHIFSQISYGCCCCRSCCYWLAFYYLPLLSSPSLCHNALLMPHVPNGTYNYVFLCVCEYRLFQYIYIYVRA